MGSMSPSAGDVVVAHIRSQVDAFHERAVQVADRDPEGVHKMRVASRQLRSALGTFHDLLDRDVTDPVRDELKWLAGLLGVARDAEVIRLRLAAAVDRQDSGVLPAGVGGRIERALVDAREAAHGDIDEVMAGPRYTSLAEALDQLAADPPLTGAADAPADEGLRGPVRRRWRQLRRAVAAAEDTDADSTALHEVRKAAKRLRYACESVTPVFGDDAAETAALAEAIQGALGEQQDSIHARSFLLRTSVDATAAGANTFGFGYLYAREEAAAATAVDDAMAAWRRLRKHRHRDWFGKRAG